MCSSGELVRCVGDALAATVARLDPPETGVGSSIRADYVALRRLVDQLETVGLRWLAALDAGGVAAADGSASTSAWVRRNTGCSGRAAAADVQLARRLHTDDIRPLTTTAVLLEQGRLSVGHARVIARATAALAPAAFDVAEPAVAGAAASLTVDATGQIAAEVCEHASELHAAGQPDPAAARRAAAEARRHLHLSRCGELYALDALLTLEAGQALQAVLAPLSVPRNEPDGLPDLRSAAQRRADAVGEAAQQLLRSDLLPTYGGQRPQLTVVVELDTLVSGRGGGRLPDGSRLSRAATERIGCDARIDWVVTNTADAGSDDLVRTSLRHLPPALGGLPREVLDAGRSQRLVTHGQRRALSVRDRGCVFPGCDRPPEWCDAHHLVHWSRGGATDLSNLALVCGRHHTVVREGGWSLTRSADGTVTADPPP